MAWDRIQDVLKSHLSSLFIEYSSILIHLLNKRSELNKDSGVSNEQGSQLNKESVVSNQQKVLTEQGVTGL